MLLASQVTFDLGSVIAGVAALLVALGAPTVLATRAARRAGKSAEVAQAATPQSLEALRAELRAVLDAHKGIVGRHIGERSKMELVIASERARADTAEAAHLHALGEVAGLRIELAAQGAEISELRSRFEAMLNVQ